jgi:hypothetical protein
VGFWPSPCQGTVAKARFIAKIDQSLSAELRPRFKNQVERGLGGAPEAFESRLHDHLAQTGFAGLGAES